MAHTSPTLFKSWKVLLKLGYTRNSNVFWNGIFAMERDSRVICPAVQWLAAPDRLLRGQEILQGYAVLV